jgi:hypothetical protein
MTGLPSQRTLCLHTPRFPLWYVRNLFKWDVWEDVGFLQNPRGGHPPDTNQQIYMAPSKRTRTEIAKHCVGAAEQALQWFDINLSNLQLTRVIEIYQMNNVH